MYDVECIMKKRIKRLKGARRKRNPQIYANQRSQMDTNKRVMSYKLWARREARRGCSVVAFGRFGEKRVGEVKQEEKGIHKFTQIKGHKWTRIKEL